MKHTIETLAVLFSIISVVLTVKKSLHSWTIGLLGIIGYMYIFWIQKLYADFLLQGVFIMQSIVGFILWKRNISREPIKVNHYTFIISMFWLFWTMFAVFSMTDNPLPILDSLAATLSIGATYLMAHKQLSCWKWWMTADIVYVGIFINQGLYLSASLYIVFFFLAWKGFGKWKLEQSNG